MASRGGWGRVVGLGTLAVLAGSAVSGCQRQLSYYSHTSATGADNYFAVPASWHSLSTADVIHIVDPKMSPVQARQVESQIWLRAFLGNPQQRVGNLSLLANNLFGEAIARPLGQAAKTFTVADLRSALLNVDPITAARSGNPYFHVLSYKKISRPGGLSGSRFVVDITYKGRQYTVAQEGLFDRANGWIYLIGFGCNTACFDSHRGAIGNVLNTWNVKEPQ